MTEPEARQVMRDIASSIARRADDPRADMRTVAACVEQQARIILAKLREGGRTRLRYAN